MHTIENETFMYYTLSGQSKIQNKRNLNKGGDTFLKEIYTSSVICIIKKQGRFLILSGNWLFSKGSLAPFTHLQIIQPSLI